MSVLASDTVTLVRVNDGEDGVGVENVIAYYAVGNSGTTQPSEPSTDSWSETAPEVGDSEFLWVAYLVVYGDGTTSWTEPCCLTDSSTRKRVTTLETELEVVQGQITARVWQTDIDEAISGISIGGRNYVLCSGGYTEGGDTGDWTVSNTTVTTNWSVTQYDGYTRWLCNTAESGSTVRIVYLPLSDEFDPTVDHVVSIRLRPSTATAIYFYGRYLNSSGSYTYRAINTSFTSSSFTPGEWNDITFTLDGQDSYAYEYFGIGLTYLKVTAGNYLDIAHVKIEQGNVATDWTPAPEDAAESITTIQDQYAIVTQTISGITTEVADLTTTVAENYSTLSSKVATLETTATSITATVRESTAIQSENIIADGTFDGYTTFGASYSWYRPSSAYVKVETYDDTSCICFTRGGSSYYVRQTVNLPAGTYIIKIKLACGDDCTPAARIRLGSVYAYLHDEEELTTGWVTYSATITTTSTSQYFYLYCYAAHDSTTTAATELYATDIVLYSSEELNAALAQIEVLSDSIALCVTTDSDTGYLRLGNGEDDTIKFTISADNISLDEDGNLALSGTITAGDESIIGGWRVTGYKICGGDSTTGVAVMQMPTEDTLYVFAAGGTSHASYADCPFRVTKDGTLISEKGTIGGWSITNYKIYGGDSDTGVAVMQRPSDETVYVFAAGGTSHESYADCPFRVNKAGDTWANTLTVAGSTTIGGSVLVPNSGIALAMATEFTTTCPAAATPSSNMSTPATS